MELLKKTVSVMLLSLLMVSLLASVFSVQLVKASGTIYIKADGSIDPATAPIQRAYMHALTGTIMLSFDSQRFQIVPRVKAEETSVPSFVTENKLVFESGATYQWFDPHVSYYQYDYMTLWHSVEMLLWYEKDNATKIIPWLAESYTVSEDKLHYNFTLRQGITFQDGTPFNATAVWFSLNRLLIIDGTSGTGVHGSQAAWMVQQLLDTSLSKGVSGKDQAYDAAWVQAVLDQNFVEILDTYKVQLNLMTATTQFLPIMAGPWAAIVSPTSTIEMDYEYGGWGTWDGDYDTYFRYMAGNGDTGLNLPDDGWKIGTGAYYVESVSPTTYKIVLKAYSNYWGGPNNINLPPTGKTRIETLEYVYQPSFATRLLNLKAGTATGIQVPEANIFQVVDRDKWVYDGILDSIVSGATVHGVFPMFNTWWLDFNTNVTNIDGTLKDWQPFADWRLRMAVACAVNMTYMNIYVNNRLSILANNIIPPGTFPAGSYNPNVKPTFSFNLTRTEELLVDAMNNPKTSFTYYNGTPIPPGVVDNSFGLDFAHAKVVELYVQSGATTFIEVLTTMTDNLNAIAKRLDMGIRFNVVIVPGGQQYMLASCHLIDAYMGGWIADYNHVLNWLQPMYLSTGTYFSWNLWNITRLDDLYDEAVIADQEGNITRLLEINDEMNTLANEILTYMVWWHDTEYYTRSTWLQGWYVNPVHGVDIWSTMYYAASPPVASFTYEPPTPHVGDAVTFNASASYDLDGDIISYDWDFGDGTIGTGMVLTHVYTTVGTYTVTLTVTDNDGLTGMDALIVTIAAIDLVVADVVLPYTHPKLYMNVTYGIGVNVTNLGSKSATTFNVSLMLWVKGGIVDYYREEIVDGLGPRANVVVHFDVKITHAGDYVLIATADCNNNVAESDETNNSMVINIDGTLGGDINGDGEVDHLDLLLLASAYGSEYGDPNYIPEADINNDDKIDHKDLLILASNYGKGI